MCCSQPHDCLPPMALLFRKLTPNAFAPIRATTQSAGFDLRSPSEIRIAIGRRQQLWLDIAIKIPTGYYGRIAPCSGLAYYAGIDIGGGVVDADYRGNVAIIIINNGNEEFLVKRGMKVAQLVVEHCLMGASIEVDELNTTCRGTLGFGEATKHAAKHTLHAEANEDVNDHMFPGSNIKRPRVLMARFVLDEDPEATKDADEDDGVFSSSSGNNKRLCVDCSQFVLPDPPESPYNEDDDTLAASQVGPSTSNNYECDLPNCSE